MRWTNTPVAQVERLLNLLYGGVNCLEAGMTTRLGAAQSSAVARIQRTVQDWDFREDVGAVESLAGQHLVGYGLGEELSSVVATDPEKVKLPRVAGQTELLELLPQPTRLRPGQAAKDRRPWCRQIRQYWPQDRCDTGVNGYTIVVSAPSRGYPW
mgnify:CR=1 FL=1